ncbi:hypothetical protein AB0T83_07355 [Fluviibacterium sp. DFM31]|uniref:Uncharacterized protein n=1 Tax=Meridianimarinicoccus marinus TaxID=3231483 RepID=A0ABV3L539_9RHOB
MPIASPLLRTALLVALPLAAPAADLTVLRSFPFPGPSGLAFDPLFCALWVANETDEIALVTLWGAPLRRFRSDLSRVDAIAVTDDHLLLSDGSGRFQEMHRDGTARDTPFRLTREFSDIDGLFVDAASGEIWITDDARAQVARLNAGGGLLARIDGATLTPPMLEPQGLTRDPNTGHLLVVDDADALDSLFEFDATGRLLDVFPLATAAYYDAEGVTLAAAAGLVFVAFDAGNTIVTYDYHPTVPADSPSDSPAADPCSVSGPPRTPLGG